MERELRSWVHPQRPHIHGVSVIFRATEAVHGGQQQTERNETRMLGALYESVEQHGFSTEMRSRAIVRKRKLQNGQWRRVTRLLVTRIAFRYRLGRQERRLVIRRPRREDFASQMLFDMLVDIVRDEKTRVQYQRSATDYSAATGTASRLMITLTPPFTPA